MKKQKVGYFEDKSRSTYSSRQEAEKALMAHLVKLYPDLHETTFIEGEDYYALKGFTQLNDSDEMLA